MISVYNSGTQIIDSFRVTLKNGSVVEVTIGDNQCKDLPDEVARAVMAEFPLARLQQFSPEPSEEVVLEQKLTDMKKELDEKTVKLADAKPICSTCGKVCKTENGLRVHSSVHKKTYESTQV